MINVTELTSAYMDSNFIHEVKTDLLNTMYMLDEFGLNDWEDQLLTIISLTETADQDDVRDLFVAKLTAFVTEILSEHKITISEDHQPSLWELNEICHFLLLVQKLEDMEFISYRLHSVLPPKRIFIEILSYLSMLTDFRAMEIIERVDQDLIESLKQMAADKEVATGGVTGLAKWKRDWDLFLAFINKTPCVGIQVSQKGFGLLSFRNLNALSAINWDFKLSQSRLSQNHAQIALDILSFTLYTEDGSQAPLLIFDKYIGVIIRDPELVSKIRPIAMSLIGDYTLYKEAHLSHSKIQSEMSE